MSGRNLQFYPVRRSVAIELIGVDDLVAVANYTKSAVLAFENAETSGEILSIQLISYETGSGLVNEPVGKLYIFDTDPAVLKNASTLSPAGADHLNAISVNTIVAADWDSDTTGAVATLLVAMPFPKTANLWFVFRMDGSGTEYNTAGGDDEILEVKVIWRRDT